MQVRRLEGVQRVLVCARQKHIGSLSEHGTEKSTEHTREPLQVEEFRQVSNVKPWRDENGRKVAFAEEKMRRKKRSRKCKAMLSCRGGMQGYQALLVVQRW